MGAMKLSEAERAGIVFGAVFALLLVLDGNRLLFGTSDEGIYLDAAERMLHGQKLYADFFGYMSPGVYWVQEGFFRIFGVNLLAGRLPVLFYFASECGLVYWLTARLASRGAALFTLFLSLAIQCADLNFLTAQHRWDSGAISLGSIALAVHGHFSGSRREWIAAGALGATAAFFTPSMALVAAATVAWLLIARELRHHALPFLTGGAVTAVALLGITAASGILIPFVEQMRWLSRNYSTVNVMAYGATIGGYRDLLAGPLNADLMIRALVVLCLALPAILPVTNLAGWTAALTLRPQIVPEAPRKQAIVYLLFCSVALVASTYPRPDLMHLAWVAPVPYVLAAALFAVALPKWAQITAVVTAMFCSTLLLLHLATTLGGVSLATPIGKVRASADSAEAVQKLLDLVKPGDLAFVYPYKPLLYFLTQTENPTRYSYLSPGLMTDQDEQSALADLRRTPPEWLLLVRLTPQEFLRVFPNGDLSKLHFQALEDWMDANYSAVNPAVRAGGYSLLRYSGGPAGR
jgi:4-amino-4-deoxy-L-arabinose transferase-like glycosyltransferase